ncbi:MAG TPA: alpha/beta hydrolase family protein [Bryobacterales bacterium]|nr:alpha/beta hydrolase family protein [Bryobacterales bacterium]
MPNFSRPNRRQFLMGAAALPAAPRLLAAPPPAAPARSYSEELPDMLLAYMAKKINALAARWDRARSEIRTPVEMEARNRFVRQKCIEMLRGLPERNPLGAVVVKVTEREGYRIENVMYQSRPDFWVTGNLYVPTSGSGPFPAILSPCGHYDTARMFPTFQFAYLDLVKSGFVVLAYDPIGQGERRQFWNPETGRNEIGGPVTWEHDMPGQLLLLIGEDLTQYRIWDGMRGIDYLLTRPEVDAKRIGCTGHSGGGTFTLFISALDERITCAAVHEGGTHKRWPLEIHPGMSIGTGDVEQHFWPAAVYGVDLVDLHIAIAPRPLLATIENYSAGFDNAASQIRERYRLLGVPEKFSTEQATDPHAWTMKLRLATTQWFSRWFYNRPGLEREPDWKLEALETLYCTPDGSIHYSHTGDTIYSRILKKQAALPPRRVRTAAQMRDEIRSLLHYQKSDHPLAARLLVSTPRHGYRIEKVQFLSEPGIYIPAWVFLPERAAGGPSILYVHEAGKEADGLEFGPLEQLAQKGRRVVSVDVRGIGETRPPHPGDAGSGLFRNLDDADSALAYWAWEIDESLFGMRVQDVVRSVDYVLSRPGAGSGVQVIGKGMGALWSLYAAALDPRIESVICEGGLLSYRSLTSVDRYLHSANIFIPNVLTHFDLPQVAAAVAARPLALVSPVDAMKAPVSVLAAREAYEPARQAYAQAAADRFRIVSRDPTLEAAEQYLALL